jgi:hypothetical protein
MKKFYLFKIFLLLNILLFAGNPGNTNTGPQSLVTSDDPDVLYKLKFYKEAIDKFLPILQKDKNDVELNYKIGLCYLLGSIDYIKAVGHLKVAAESGKAEIDTYYMLGKAFQNALIFDKAINAFEKSLEILKSKSDATSMTIKKRCEKEIQNCKYAITNISSPIDVTFENIGKEVNSAFSDLGPYITPNKTELVFSSNRAEGNQCEKPRKQGYTFDAYMSINKAGKWGRATNMGSSVNTPLNERVSSISSDGGIMFFYIDNEESTKDGDIYVSTANGKTFNIPVSLKGLVNSGAEESNASISNDGSKLYFASDRAGGEGEKDIYVAKKLPNGDWAEPKRLSNTINTIYNEDYPVIMPDDKTLYFASEGHNNYGGYDIFKSEWVDTLNDWSTPENIGYPVNTPQNNYNISITEKMHEGYISAIRPEGLGDYDIYKIIFNDAVSAPYATLRSRISNTDPNGINTEVTVNVTNKSTQKLIGKYNISAKKKGDFFAVFHPGEYQLEFINSQSKPYSTDLVVLDKNIRGEIIKKDFTLTSLIEQPAIVEPKKVGKEKTKPKTKK